MENNMNTQNGNNRPQNTKVSNKNMGFSWKKAGIAALLVAVATGTFLIVKNRRAKKQQKAAEAAPAPEPETK